MTAPSAKKSETGLSDGKYIITCAGYPDRVMDLSDGIATPENPVIGYHPHGGHNQQWHVETPTDGQAQAIRSELQTNNNEPLYVADSKKKPYPQPIAVQLARQTWSIESAGKVGDKDAYRINYPGEDSVITLPNNEEKTQLVRIPWTGEDNQKWYFDATT